MSAMMESSKKSTTSTRGFASMDPEKQRAIARKGGESVPHEKRSFSQNPRLAAEAGRKGGQASIRTSAAFPATTLWPPKRGARAGMPRTAAPGSPWPKNKRASSGAAGFTCRASCRRALFQGRFTWPGRIMTGAPCQWVPRVNAGYSRFTYSFFKIRALPSFGFFFPSAVRLGVEMGFVSFARCQHETSARDLPRHRIKNHNALIAATRSKRHFCAASLFRLSGQGQHASGILAAIPQDGIPPRRAGG